MRCHLGIRFRLQVLRYAAAMESLALSLLPVFATALDLDKNFFEAAFESQMFRLRLSHYPPANPDTDQYGIAPHTDTSFLTLLAQVDAFFAKIYQLCKKWYLNSVLHSPHVFLFHLY